ncbi:hypothetical protein VCHA28O22_10878 [Vibrio chagasii]|nr:hypothetical protein VCHA28O22_10878 [Vibrio chagasii]CAH7031104.1 hypothetical protein VCHA39P226_10102 [Vibrio chagasii]CAH7047871.1 hypothetical protein VCHA52P453_10058 [Vibrio chagasii]CAH7064248.1 hypothetical protein VCHA52P456_10102 [Vibrio chagasii]CAH7158139.1 hypothetical protein VCHA53O474_10881 [Vibrio chagasii]
MVSRRLKLVSSYLIVLVNVSFDKVNLIYVKLVAHTVAGYMYLNFSGLWL